MNYKVKSGEVVVYEGNIAASSIEQAQSYAFSILKGRRLQDLSIEIDGVTTFSNSKLFERHIANKIDHRPKLPWQL